MKFKYTALTPQNDRVSGALEADNQTAAQAELHRLQLAIVSIEQITDEAYLEWQAKQADDKIKKGIKTFRFVAIDGNQKTVDGTIDATTGEKAFERLFKDYHFRVESIYPNDATEEQKKAFAAQLIEWKKVHASEIKQEEELKNLEAQEEKINMQMVQEVDRLINQAKKTLSDHPDLFSPALTDTIETKLDELERVRTSNNLKHITEIGNELFSALKNPDQIDGKSPELAVSHQSAIEQMESNELIKKELLIYQKALSVKGLKSLFGQIMNRLKTFRTQLEPESPEDHRTFWQRLFHRPASKPSAPQSPAPAPLKSDEPVSSAPSTFHLFIREANSFVAWLVFFYLSFFLLANLVVEKQFIFVSTPFFFRTLQSPFIFNVSLFFVWIYATLLVVDHYLYARKLSAGLFTLSSMILFAFVVVNF